MNLFQILSLAEGNRKKTIGNWTDQSVSPHARTLNMEKNPSANWSMESTRDTYLFEHAIGF